MGKCSFCQKKIEYNDFIVKRGKIYHPKCWEQSFKQARKVRKRLSRVITPTTQAVQQASEYKVDLHELKEE